MIEYETKKNGLALIQKGRGLRYILSEAYKILHNPVLAHDMEYNVLAYTEEAVSDDPIWLEFTEKGKVERGRLEFYKDENFFEIAANTKKVTLLTSDRLKYDRMYGKLFSGEGIQIGCACMTELDGVFAEHDIELFEILCDIMNSEIAHDEYFSRYARDYQEKLICNLIDDMVDKELYTAHIESLYKNLEENLYLAVIQPNGENGDCNEKLSALCGFFIKTFPSFKYAVYNDCVVAIISSDKPLRKSKDFDQLNETLRQSNASMGLSGCFGNLFELNVRYREARTALNSLI